MIRSQQSRFAAAGLLLFLLLAAGALAQVTDKPPANAADNLPRVWLEGPGLSGEALQADIAFVRFVTDRAQAQVIVTVEPARVLFAGRGEYEKTRAEYPLGPEPNEPPDRFRTRLVQTLRLGLLRYASKSPAAGLLSVSLLDAVKPTSVVDPWNFWVFSVSGNTFVNGEKSYAMSNLFGSFSANRVTPDWKLRMSAGLSLSRNRYTLEDYDYTSDSHSTSFSGLAVKSLGDHWSAGVILEFQRSTYANTRWGVNPRPAIEYDVFPYAESTKRQFRFLYTIGPTFIRYDEPTIYDKTRESLLGQSLTAALEFKQPWGALSADLTGSHYFHDLSKYRVELSAEVSIRLFKGFNVNFEGSGSRVHDQLNLAKGGATLEEVLLQRKQLATGYSYSFQAGFSYSFGSIFSNIINPRFGSGNGGFSMNISM